MIIPITLPSNPQNLKLPPSLAKISHDEVVLIELQGSLEVEASHINEKDGKLVGKLKLDGGNDKPTMLIGHHLLEGKIVSLTKPLAVIHRSRVTSKAIPMASIENDPAELMNVDDDESVPDVSGQNAVEWNVVAIVKKKIVFSQRPMPMVNLKTK